MQYLRRPLWLHSARLVGSLLLFALGCLLMLYAVTVLHNFSNTYETNRLRHEQIYIRHAVGWTGFPCQLNTTEFACIYCNQTARSTGETDQRHRAFDETVVQVLQQYEALEYIGCFDRDSLCFQGTLYAMHWVLNRTALLSTVVWVVVSAAALMLFASGPYASMRSIQTRQYQLRLDDIRDQLERMREGHG
jgi:hypothetical protein